MDPRIKEIYPRVKKAVEICSDRESDEITLESRLVADLGMESLDFVELVYELEQAFDITIPMGTIDLELEDAMEGEPTEVDGVLTPAALQKLREMVPGLHDDGSDAVSVDDVPLMITVHSVCGLLLMNRDADELQGGGTQT